MSPLPTSGHDLRAVVRAADALTTQVRRIADALTTTTAQAVIAASSAQQTDFVLTPDAADDTPTTVDDGPCAQHPHAPVIGGHCGGCTIYPADMRPAPRIEGPVPLATTCGHCGHPYNWHASRGACEFGHEEIRCSCDTFTVGERPEPIDPRRILGAEAPATDEADTFRHARAWAERHGLAKTSDDSAPAPPADEDALRATRRESARIILDRATRGIALRGDEAALLRQHFDAEIREHDTARAVARSNLRHVQQLVPELEAADPIRAEVQRDRDQHAAVLSEVLRQFTHETHPGRRCLQSGHVPVETVERWRSVVAPTVERPWWQQAAEAQARVRQLETAIRKVLDICGDQGSDVQDILRAALDGTEQPTTEA